MSEDRDRSLKWQRYEAKYLVTETQAARIRSYCKDYLPPDPYSAGRRENEYPVLSIYLDSPSQLLLQHTLAKQIDRFKLRVRTYRACEAPADGLPAFFEIKRKIKGTVQKTRARVLPGAVDSLVWNGLVPPDESDAWDEATRMNVNEFQSLRSRIRAAPIVGTCYMREAYEGISAERTRITLDRNLHYGMLAPPGSGQRDMWWPIDQGSVILEVKFTGTYPYWVKDMLRRVEVLRRGVCKYAICCRAAGVPIAREADQGRL